ncbi:MAG: TRAM domain-containing protein [Natronomonas sp.]
MEISNDLLCLYTAEIERRDGSYVISVPEREVTTGDLEAGGTYRIAVLPQDPEPTTSAKPATEPEREEPLQAPPVEEGETRRVEIEDIGEQGDGIARVERGFVIIVPDTEQGERVRIEVTDVQQNVAFGEVVERLSYYD